MSTDYEFLPDGRFLIKNYNQKKPFSNFLPGIAGLFGTPMWVFYVNRGQGIASFGTKDKDSAILEFFPANKAYQAVTTYGFRTFIKLARNDSSVLKYEPFKEQWSDQQHVTQELFISAHEFEIHEINRLLGLEFKVRYFTVPGEAIAVLARELEVRNISKHTVHLDLLDGLPSVNPYGMNEFFIKNMSRTIEAWMVAENVEKNAPYFRLRVDATDRPEVTFIEEGNFFFSCLGGGRKDLELLEAIVDPDVIFGSLLDFSRPKVFYEESPYKHFRRQVTENKTPCAFNLASMKLNSGQAKSIFSYFGQANSLEILNRFAAKARRTDFISSKREENRKLIEGIKNKSFTITSKPAYDHYCQQTYLDNIMRGGMPISLGDKENPLVYYVYSRKHGDLERDYNRFLVDPTAFSQGNGNYRDVNQNRRNDVWFDPYVKDTNIKTFLNLIQLDGFNPLVIKGTRFHLKLTPESKSILSKAVSSKHSEEVLKFIKNSFSPGEFYRLLNEKKLVSPSGFAQLLAKLSPYLIREEVADHGEGFWVDHWTYNLDLIESYLSIYPEDAKNLLFERKEYSFFDNDHVVEPRSSKYHAEKSGLRQFKAVVEDKEKKQIIKERATHAHVVRTSFGKGELYKTTLFSKLITLFVNKFASLDSFGKGIEMEADKPSWYDALNGLPGLLGSSLCETFELKRLGLFLFHAIEDHAGDLNREVSLPEEVHEFLYRLDLLLDQFLKNKKSAPFYDFWEKSSSLKESFRAKTKFGLSGKEKRITCGELKIFFEHAREKIEMGLDRSFDDKTKLYPTYYRHDAIKYSNSKPVKVTEFKQSALPSFLEGPVHALKVERDPEKKRELLRAVRQSPLYDNKLSMYKVNAPMASASLEIGRARVFAPGWLENESIWLHMEYKFLLEILKSGMTDEFIKDFRKVLVPFQPAERYGRSITENSSFIVSSAFKDANLHGTGFVARLSGSTAEFLHIWLIMNIGRRPFFLGPDGKLSLRFEPHLPADFFTKSETVRVYTDSKGEEHKVKIPKNSLAFLFLGKTLVVYHNPKELDTFGKLRVAVKKVTLKTLRGESIDFRQDVIPSPYAQRIRDEFIPRIDIELG